MKTWAPDEAKVPGTAYTVEMMDQFLEDAKAAREAALSPARALLDDSPARRVALDLQSDLVEAVALYRGHIDARLEIERDTDTRPEVLRQRWDEAAREYEQRLTELRPRIDKRTEELKATLETEALPVSTDPAAVLLARQEVELALRTSGHGALTTMTTLAARGGDIAATVASEWGRMTLKGANSGSEDGFDLVRREAIRAALHGSDERQRRAAAALDAIAAPRPGGRAASLYEARLKTDFALNVGASVR